MNEQIILNGQLVSYGHYNSQKQNGCLIFLHGWRSNKEVWNGVVGKLGGSAIYQIDLPGFGKSQAPSRTMTVGDYAEVVKGFIEKLGLSNVIVVGHSFGGRIGIKLASKNPEFISKLVLVDSAGFAMDSQKKTAMNLAAKIVKPFFKPKFMQGLRKSIYKQIGSEDYVATPELQRTFVNVVSEDLTKDMGQIKCPTLIINGQNDKDTPVEFGRRMQSLIPNSKFLILKNAGHFSFLDQPEEFEQELIRFIA
jgi:pimeloyl-ACP methyl ester carboxylesterase